MALVLLFVIFFIAILLLVAAKIIYRKGYKKGYHTGRLSVEEEIFQDKEKRRAAIKQAGYLKVVK